MKLAERRCFFRSVSSAIDHCPADTTDTLPTVAVYGNRFPAIKYKLLIDDIDHLEKGHFRRNILCRICFESSPIVRSVLTPDLERYVDGICHL